MGRLSWLGSNKNEAPPQTEHLLPVVANENGDVESSNHHDHHHHHAGAPLHRAQTDPTPVRPEKNARAGRSSMDATTHARKIVLFRGSLNKTQWISNRWGQTVNAGQTRQKGLVRRTTTRGSLLPWRRRSKPPQQPQEKEEANNNKTENNGDPMTNRSNDNHGEESKHEETGDADDVITPSALEHTDNGEQPSTRISTSTTEHASTTTADSWHTKGSHNTPKSSSSSSSSSRRFMKKSSAFLSSLVTKKAKPSETTNNNNNNNGGATQQQSSRTTHPTRTTSKSPTRTRTASKSPNRGTNMLLPQNIPRSKSPLPPLTTSTTS